MQRDAGIGAQLGWIAEELKALARVQEGLHKLYTSVLGRDVSLDAVLREVAVTAMDLVSARYGALGVLSADGEHLTEFITFGLTEEEEVAAASLGVPRGRGLLAHLMADPRPVRVDSISEHPMAAGLREGIRSCMPYSPWGSGAAATGTGTCSSRIGATVSPSTNTMKP